MMPSRGTSCLLLSIQKTPFATCTRSIAVLKQQIRLASERSVKIVLPSPTFIKELGRTFDPPVSPRQLDNDIDKLVGTPDIKPEQLKTWFGNGRNLVAYQRIIERSLLEDPQRKPSQEMTDSYTILFRASLVVNNQLAISRQCMTDLVARDQTRKDKGLKVLAELKDTNLPAAFFLTGNMYADNRLYDNAIVEFKKCISASKAHLDAKPKLEMLDYDYDREIDFSHMVKSTFMLGKVYEEVQDYYSARTHYLEALALQEVSKEKIPPMEIMALNFLATLAEWENNEQTAQYYALRSAMRGNMYGLSSMAKYVQRYESDQKWTQVWSETYQIQNLLDRNLKIAIISPEFKPVAVVIDHGAHARQTGPSKPPLTSAASP
ncbi:hypothetical protein V1512DRAFT_256793 [Lipomyces arxii]|uniref:uncharacterized protein n=1 Tax=Lipomyces arxii TaxID=56418 RepID=UPI0034CE2983